MPFTGLENLVVPESGQEGYFVVGLADILGQREWLLAYDDPPPAGLKNREKVKELRLKTLSPVRAFRKDFHDQFFSYEKTISNSPLNCITGPVGAFLDSLGSEPIGVHPFSDLVALSLPLESRRRTVPMEGVFLMIATSGMASLCSLYRGHPVRGGIELDLAWPIVHHGALSEIYGPALAKAYHLESRLADYPRIVVGHNLCDFIELNAKLPDPSDPNRIYADLTRRLLVTDDDCQMVINPYSDWYRVEDREGKHRRIAEHCVAFAINEHKKFESQNNAKLTVRYARLTAFIQKHGFA